MPRPHLIWVRLISCAAWLLLAACRPATALEPPALAHCFESAATWARVHPTLLRAIARVESDDNPAAVNWNANGTYDVGLMQINSWWRAHGLAPLWNQLGHPCANIAAGAWVFKQCTDDHGYTWEAVGCYNAGTGWSRSPAGRQAATRYIRRVQAAIAALPRAWRLVDHHPLSVVASASSRTLAAAAERALACSTLTREHDPLRRRPPLASLPPEVLPCAAHTMLSPRSTHVPRGQ